MIKLFCGILALMMMASLVATGAEPAGIEVRMRNSIGRLGLVDPKATVKTEADGRTVVSFQASKEGTYYLVYTTGPKKGKNATTVNVAKPGPVTTKIKQ
jgi:5-hydroxyisourate hydrolase-like protein (transthyretin family)